MKMKNWKKIIVGMSAGLLLAACGEETAPETQTDPDEETAEEEGVVEEEGATDEDTDETGTDPEMAALQIEMYNSDSELVGTATFDEQEDGVMLHLNLENVPAGEYGMHIHEVGQATPPSFEDAGDHFNPTGADHGFDAEDGHHLGDLPNLVIPENGVVNETIEIPEVSLLPDAEYTLATEEGTSLIIHTEPDDYETQPTGDAGERMIGGVIFSPEN
jgi:Cu-Zn family superoxide dismutase